MPAILVSWPVGGVSRRACVCALPVPPKAGIQMHGASVRSGRLAGVGFDGNAESLPCLDAFMIRFDCRDSKAPSRRLCVDQSGLVRDACNIAPSASDGQSGTRCTRASSLAKPARSRSIRMGKPPRVEIQGMGARLWLHPDTDAGLRA